MMDSYGEPEVAGNNVVYRIKDELLYSVNVQEWDGNEWKPYVVRFLDRVDSRQMIFRWSLWCWIRMFARIWPTVRTRTTVITLQSALGMEVRCRSSMSPMCTASTNSDSSTSVRECPSSTRALRWAFARLNTTSSLASFWQHIHTMWSCCTVSRWRLVLWWSWLVLYCLCTCSCSLERRKSRIKGTFVCWKESRTHQSQYIIAEEMLPKKGSETDPSTELLGFSHSLWRTKSKSGGNMGQRI